MFAQDTLDTIEGKFYATDRGSSIYMPLGDISFADTIKDLSLGKPSASEEFSDPKQALNEPDYVHYKVPKYISLGCKGQLTLEFSDNGFVDMEGPDLFIWEVGPSEERFHLEISKNGRSWRSLDTIAGGKSSVDIAPVVNSPKEIFYFVRITDVADECTGHTPGVDIDAVGTISGILKVNLNADILFDFDAFTIKERAKEDLQKLVRKLTQIGMAEIIVEGHTDADGNNAYNDVLSEKRALAVVNYLKSALKDKGKYSFKHLAFGKSKPRATNKTKEGRQKNRRVEVIVLPHKDFYKTPLKHRKRH